MRKGRVWIYLGVLVVLIILALVAIPRPNLLAGYPADAALNYIKAQAAPNQTVEGFTLCAARQLNDGLIIQSSHVGRTPQGMPVYSASYAWVKPFFWLWYADRGQTVGVGALPKYVLYGSQILDKNLIVYGRVLSPEVSVIEAHYKEGGVQRTFPDHECFLFSTDASQILASLKVLDKENKVLAEPQGESSLETK